METKVIYHGTSAADASGHPGNPPPYSGPPPQTYQPQPGYTAPGVYPYPQTTQPMQATVISTVVPTVMIANQMGPKPAPFVCKSCNQQIITRVESKPTLRTHMFALLLCLFGCWPCVCLPYCMDTCLTADHYCPNCNSYIGSYIN